MREERKKQIKEDSETIKIEIPKGIILAVEALLSERTIKTEGGEIIRVEATPVLSDLTAHTDYKVGNYTKTALLGLIGFMANFVSADDLIYYEHLGRKSARPFEYKEAANRLAVNYTVNTPVDSMGELHENQNKKFEELYHALSRQNDQLRDILMTLMQTMAYSVSLSTKQLTDENKVLDSLNRPESKTAMRALLKLLDDQSEDAPTVVSEEPSTKIPDREPKRERLSPFDN